MRAPALNSFKGSSNNKKCPICLSEWIEEFRQYHRKDGRIVKTYDDLLGAKRYGVMMLRMTSSRFIVEPHG
jgi:hypothetical protein